MPAPITIPVKSNLVLTVRERGKVKRRSQGHNIFLNLGREWLPKLISYADLPAGSPPPPQPVTPEEDRRVRYMGLGIGGNRQLSLAQANAAPLITHYPGTNGQTDTDPTVLRLERPVRVSSPVPSNPAVPPLGNVLNGDVWLGQIQAPASYPVSTSVTYRRVFSETDISYGPFLSVPLSEIGLFLHSDSTTYVNQQNNTCIAYDTFDTLSKTTAFSLEVAWTIRF